MLPKWIRPGARTSEFVYVKRILVVLLLGNFDFASEVGAGFVGCLEMWALCYYWMVVAGIESYKLGNVSEKGERLQTSIRGIEQLCRR